MSTIANESILTCPECAFTARETMPDRSCLIAYRCRSCGADLWPAPGDCCVFCTYGSIPCQAIQQQRAP